MARMCAEKESELLAQGIAFHIQHRSFAITAVISAVCFLEAHVNEVFADAADDNAVVRQRVRGIPEEAMNLLAQLWNGPEVAAGDRLAILAKYQLALVACGKSRMAANRNPFQKAQKLVDLRNALVHFKPEWQEHDVAHKLEKKLKPAGFAENRLPVGYPWYPNKCLAAGCAEWACETSCDFVNDWRSKMGLVRNYEDDFADWASP